MLPAAPLSVYVGSTDGFVSALVATTGVMRWRTQVSHAPTASAVRVAALAAGTLYAIATDVGKRPGTTVLTALRASDGSALWQKTFVGSGTVVAASQGAVYLALDGNGSVANTIEMLRAQDGAVLWRLQVAGTGPLHASMYDGTIYVTSFTAMLPSPGYYYATTLLYTLDAKTGTVHWHSEIGRTNYVATVANGEVYLVDTGTDVVCDPNVLHVLSAGDGAERWQVAGTLLRLLGVEQGRAYVTDVPQGCSAFTYEQIALHALNTDNGSSVWQIDLQSQYYGGPLAYGMIYLPGESNALAAYSARDGSLLWYVQGENGRLWVFGGELYTSISGWGLDALNRATGAVRWRYRTSDQVSLASVAQGILYGVSSHQIANAVWNQTVVAVRTTDGKLLWRFPIGAGTDTDAPIVG
jgi:outer membrane protein assembly factor BamB